jgi:thioredoxin-related protein
MQTKVGLMICVGLLFGVGKKTFSQNSGVVFKSDLSWKDIVHQAKVEHKYIFVDCYTTWCEPCKRMDQEVYPTSSLGKYFSEHFICVKVQMDTLTKDDTEIKSEYAEAHKIRADYSVNAYPTFLFFSEDGKIVHRGVAYHDTTGMVQMAAAAMNPNTQYYTLLSRYQNNELQPLTKYKDLAQIAARIGESKVAHDAANAYIDKLDFPQLLGKSNLDFLYANTTSSSDRGFALFRDSVAAFLRADARYDSTVCKGVLVTIIYREAISPYQTIENGRPDFAMIHKNLEKFGRLGIDAYRMFEPRLLFASSIKPALDEGMALDSVLAICREQNLGSGEKYLVGKVVIYYEGKMKSGEQSLVDAFFGASEYYIKHYPGEAGAPQLNEFAFTVFQFDSSVAHLKQALIWAKTAVDSTDTKDRLYPSYLDSYSNILYRLGDRKAAISLEERAVAGRPRDTSLSATLEKMRAGEPTW